MLYLLKPNFSLAAKFSNSGNIIVIATKDMVYLIKHNTNAHESTYTIIAMQNELRASNGDIAVFATEFEYVTSVSIVSIELLIDYTNDTKIILIIRNYNTEDVSKYISNRAYDFRSFTTSNVFTLSKLIYETVYSENRLVFEYNKSMFSITPFTLGASRYRLYLYKTQHIPSDYMPYKLTHQENPELNKIYTYEISPIIYELLYHISNHIGYKHCIHTVYEDIYLISINNIDNNVTYIQKLNI